VVVFLAVIAMVLMISLCVISPLNFPKVLEQLQPGRRYEMHILSNLEINLWWCFQCSESVLKNGVRIL